MVALNKFKTKQNDDKPAWNPNSKINNKIRAVGVIFL